MSYKNKGIGYLRKKLSTKRSRVLKRYEFYEMKDRDVEMNAVIPPALAEQYRATLGWCAKAVDSLADRLQFRGFKDDYFNMYNIFQMNNADILFDSAILGALISSCDFIYISSDEIGYPRMQVIDGSNATGIMDEITGMLYEGYAVLQRSENEEPILEAYFEPGKTTIIEKGGNEYSVANAAPYPLLVPIINRPDAKRNFGHSRISRACMNLQKEAKSTLTRMDVSAEFYSFPQKYIVGLDSDADPMEKWKATISSFLQFQHGEDGSNPSLGQFAQQSMSPYTEQLRTIASVFAGETGLTIDDLGFSTGNPASAEAIKASHENLRLIARKAQRTFGTGFLNAGYLAACIRDNCSYRRKQIYLTTAIWEPIFEPDAAAMSGVGDAAIKINQAVPGYFGKDNLRELVGVDSDETGVI